MCIPGYRSLTIRSQKIPTSTLTILKMFGAGPHGAPSDGDDATAERVLALLAAAGFSKALSSDWSAFERSLCGISWLLQRAVARERAQEGRVQWDALSRPHESMRARLGFAQDVARRVELLGGAIQPHQLLLQDFADVGAVERLVKWLAELASEPPHLVAIQRSKKFLDVVDRDRRLQVENDPLRPVSRDVAFLQRAFAPRRRWRYTAENSSTDEQEDELIQRCLFEYGERVAVVTAPDEDEDQEQDEEAAGTDKVDLMAQIASQVAARAAAVAAGGALPKKKAASRRSLRVVDADFDKQYQKARKVAMREQQERLVKQRQREVQLLQQVVSVPEETSTDEQDSAQQDKLLLEKLKADMQVHEVLVQELIEQKTAVDSELEVVSGQAGPLDEAMTKLQLELQETNEAIEREPNAPQYLSKLRELLQQNEDLKIQKETFRVQCRTELDEMHRSIEQLKSQANNDANNQEEVMKRLEVVETKHEKVRAKHAEMKRALATQTKQVQLKMKQVDEIPTKIELIQYEKRFAELFDEVALTLDETRKYYSVYNTLKTTQEYLEKEISLINSIYENFDVAMSSKAATQAFFTQVDSIVHNIRGALAKQETQRKNHELEMETLDSKYQVLLERERSYVSAVRDFQKECEKNDRLTARLQEAAAQATTVA